MKRNNIIKFFKEISFVFLIIIFGSCSFTKRNNNQNEISAKINDSLDINISLDNDTKNYSLISITNNLTGRCKCIGFHEDGVTVSSVGVYKDRLKEDGLYYRYYSSGRLNLKVCFKDGKYNGVYEYYSSEGVLIYKAFYENGVEKDVIKGSLEEDEIEIVEIDEE